MNAIAIIIIPLLIFGLGPVPLMNDTGYYDSYGIYTQDNTKFNVTVMNYDTVYSYYGTPKVVYENAYAIINGSYIDLYDEFMLPIESANGVEFYFTLSDASAQGKPVYTNKYVSGAAMIEDRPIVTPEEPVTPTEPALPEEPVTPTEPETPALPEEPVTPTEPETPAPSDDKKEDNPNKGPGKNNGKGNKNDMKDGVLDGNAGKGNNKP